jgi:hypothetical protein
VRANVVVRIEVNGLEVHYAREQVDLMSAYSHEEVSAVVRQAALGQTKNATVRDMAALRNRLWPPKCVYCNAALIPAPLSTPGFRGTCPKTDTGRHADSRE